MSSKRVSRNPSYFPLLAVLVTPMLMLAALLLALPAAPVASLELADAVMSPQADPTSITLVGNLQAALGVGCSDWAPDCAASHLTEIANGVWRGEFSITTTTPTTWEYKMALNDSWDVSYTGNHTVNSNTSLSLTTTSSVTFYYDHKTNAVLDSVMDEVAVATGSFQNELGCAADWSPDCVASLMTDVDGDGIYTFQSNTLPAGSYDFKVAFDEAWGGDVPASNVTFNVTDAGDIVTLSWDSSNDDVTVDIMSGWTPVSPASVTLVGNLQAALGVGCSDWTVDCAASHLTEIANGVWRGEYSITTTTPTTWEYKMALNDSWDVSYTGNHTVNGNTTLSLTTTSSVTFYYDHKTHAVLDSVMDEVAVATGDFQSEVGCAADWDAACVASLMTDVDADGVYKFQTTALSAGTYEFKVAFDEDIAGALPASNVSMTLAEAKTNVIISWDSATDDVTYTLQTSSDLAAPAVQHAFQDEVFYFLMPDRFQNGDATNNEGGIAGDKNDHGFDPTDRAFYHGGDLQGVLDEMDYLEQMGVTSLWLAPVFKNRPVQGAYAAHHGYWIVDFTTTDTHLGTDLLLNDVITEAHSRGIKVYFDIVVNHTGDVIDYQEAQYSYRTKTDYPYLNEDSVAFEDRDYLGVPFPVLSKTVSFPYTPIITIADTNIKSPAWLNDPIYYHNRGEVGNWDDLEQSTYGDFPGGLDDLFTENQVVVNGMIDIYKDWIDIGVDGFRIDTVKHVNLEFWQEFGPAIMDYAETQGIADFFMFGEVFSSDRLLVSQFTDEGLLPSLLDFGFQGAATSYAANGNPSDGLENFFALDDYYTDPDTNVYLFPTFLSNHDIGRLGNTLINGGASDAEMVARSQLAHALMYFARGVPVVYYGDEQGFTGDGGYEGARQDMFASQVASYNDDDLLGTTDTTAVDNFDDTHPLYLAFADYADLYTTHKALRRGAQVNRYSTDTAGVYAFSRIDRDEQIEYVIAFNNDTSDHDATFPVFEAGMGFTAIYTADDATLPTALTSDVQQQVTVTVPALSFVIYQADAALAASTEAPAISFTLTNGSEISSEDDSVEISVTLGSDNVFAEVTFAVRVGTEIEYVQLGTDTNAPYRVFFDVSDLPVGTPVSFKAIVHDLNGHYNAAQVETEVGEYVAPVTGAEYAVIHYQRPAADYGDYSSSDFNDYWGLHLWGDGLDEEGVTWSTPKKFVGFDDFGAYVAIKLSDPAELVNYIVHKGNDKDTPDNRDFDPSLMPELWIVQGDAANYGSRAAAQGYATVHYTRTAGDFTGWELNITGGGTIADYEMDDFGAVYTIPVSGDATTPISFTVENTGTPDGAERGFVPADHPEIWLVQGEDNVYPHRGAVEDYALIHYRRVAGDYGNYTSSDFNDYWGVHSWGGAVDPGWTTPYKSSALDDYGASFKIDLNAAATDMGFILHRGGDKDPSDTDQSLDFTTTGYEIWVGQSLASDANVLEKYTHPAIPMAKLSGALIGDLSKQQAYWLSEDTLAWDIATDISDTYLLHYDAAAGLTLEAEGVMGGEMITLTVEPLGLPQAIKDKFPHLAGLAALKIGAADLSKVPSILKSQFAISAIDNVSGDLRDATGLQIPGVLDDLYTYSGDLGITFAGDVPTLRLWAPTAQNVTFHLFDDAAAATTSVTSVMSYDANYGVWTVVGDAAWEDKFYLYEVDVFAPSTGAIEKNLVTDPYAVSLSMNSTRSQIVNLASAELKPANWDSYTKPELARPEDISVYEIHVRDFSVNDSTSTYSGTFKAFTEASSNGVQHLQELADAGLTHLHLLPVMDIATINEDKSTWQDADYALLATYPASSTQQQTALSPYRDQDGFNWGYDPFHYSVPEGSYSTDPNGSKRILEFREMVQSINGLGLRVVIDVVYNHTNSHGQAAKSVLDKIVPGYYHRLNASGLVESSTCCSNTASEHDMMEKLMIDSVVLWAKYYKVDAFRFDLMGHHMKEDMVELRAALDSLTLANDGVDGSSIYIYGEGWNFGEVADNARGINATQVNMAGTGIGTFNDRARDAARGGSPFDSGEGLVRNQGFINGLYYDPNYLGVGVTDALTQVLHSADIIRVGLAGNLKDYSFVGASGDVITGAGVLYNGSPTGYTLDPQENVIYISKHDNQTLFDNNQYKMPRSATLSDRVRAQNVGVSLVTLAQGVPFFQAGTDMLRSKSMDRDSYNSNDWFNRLDFSYQSNNWGVGLPPSDVGGQSDNWPFMEPLLGDPDLKPLSADIMGAVYHMRETLQIRASSPLFHLENMAEVQSRLSFYNTGVNQIPGLIVMGLEDMAGALDPNYSQIVVLFNANDEAQSFTSAEFAGVDLILHPVQAAGHDVVVKAASFTSGTGNFSIPGRTAAVFVQGRANAAINKTVETAPLVQLGDTVTYTITFSNHGSTMLQNIMLTDTLPTQLYFSSWVTQPSPAATVDGNTISWSGNVSSNVTITLSFVTNLYTETLLPPDNTIINTAVYMHATGGGQDTASFNVTSAKSIFLPLVLKASGN